LLHLVAVDPQDTAAAVVPVVDYITSQEFLVLDLR
tara:strand:+ start:365 stop:469 length:105 start_codon:yes stop_codon:yes gene_type:complete